MTRIAIVAQQAGAPRTAPPPHAAPVAAPYRPIVHCEPGFVGGTFGREPEYVVLHGSRSGRPKTTRQELDGTRHWARANPDGYGWNVTVGDDEYSIHLDAGLWGHHASGISHRSLSCELAQPTAAYPVTDAMVRALCHWLAAQVFPRHPNLAHRIRSGAGLHLVMPTHAEVERWGWTTAWWGKSDVFPFGDPRADALRARILTRLANPAWYPAP